jgi:DNA-binding NarL/FixJ family response regulator
MIYTAMPVNHELVTQVRGLLETLALLREQIRADQAALPPNQVQARLALATLEQIAVQAQHEAMDIAELVELPSPDMPHLSPREMEVLRLAAEGMTNKEIAYRLGLSERTVQYHLNSIYNKTTTNSRTEATAAAIRHGWI